MGIIRRIKANFRQRQGLNAKRIDDGTASFVSYDMTEISTSEEEIESPKEKMLQSLRERSRSPDSTIVAPQHVAIQPCSSSLSVSSEMSYRARDILVKAFPGVSFDDYDELGEEDLTQYPDPDDQCLQLHASTSSDDDDDDCGNNLFRGLTIDTSIGGSAPSRAFENDEFLVHSPAECNKNKFTSCSSKISSSPKRSPKKKPAKSPTDLIVVTTTTTTTTSMAQQPRNKLAHIFTEELSTLYEQDETLDDSKHGNNKESRNRSKEQLHQDDEDNERSIHNRWNDILEMTITGHCANHRFVVMEAEI